MDFNGKRLVHTPEGVRDIYGAEYAKKIQIHQLFHESLRSFGYQDIQTPTFEYFDVFGSKIGTIPSKELYKFFDKEGNTLVLRPDFTPSIARCAAKYFSDETMPIRFCYEGNTFVNTSNLQGKLKEVTQMGAELIGDATAQADAEMVAMMIEALLHTGLTKFQVSVGQIEFFKGLCEEAGLDEETEDTLREYISIRNYFGAEELLSGKLIPQKYIDVLLKVGDMLGNADTLQEAKKLVTNQRSLSAIKRLEEVYDILKIYGVDHYVSFDLGMVSKYNYYTGVIVKAYTYGIGDAIAKGGRYDNLISQFGKETPATGFVVIIDDLVAAITRQKIEVSIDNKNVMMVYGNEVSLQTAIEKAKELREQGLFVTLMKKTGTQNMKDYIQYAENNNISCVYQLTENGNMTEERIS